MQKKRSKEENKPLEMTLNRQSSLSLSTYKKIKVRRAASLEAAHVLLASSCACTCCLEARDLKQG